MGFSSLQILWRINSCLVCVHIVWISSCVYKYLYIHMKYMCICSMQITKSLCTWQHHPMLLMILSLRHGGHCCSRQRLPKEIARHWDWSRRKQFTFCFARLCQVSCDIPWISTSYPNSATMRLRFAHKQVQIAGLNEYVKLKEVKELVVHKYPIAKSCMSANLIYHLTISPVLLCCATRSAR